MFFLKKDKKLYNIRKKDKKMKYLQIFINI